MTTFQMPQPKQGRAKETVSLVIESARRAMKRAGESAVRVQEISMETGVSIGSIYHHFGDREGLIRAAYVGQFGEIVKADIERLKSWSIAINSTEDLRAHYDEMLAFLAKHFEIMPLAERAAIVGSALGRKDLRDAIAEAHTRLTDGLTEVMQNLSQAGVLKAHLVPRAAAQVILGLLHGRVLAELDNDQTTSAEDWNKAALSAFSGLVRS
ncbi:MAG: TetR/AcrR family transcriptional regulator [Actinomycetales bacterium]|nr:TetR/AcrR family transcriptional regulator [Actinomycetales bacterium]